MVQFIGTIDPSRERRAQFVRQAQRDMESFYGSPAQVCERGDLAMVSWAEPWEPSHRAESAAGVAFVWGDAAERGKSFGTSLDLARL